MYQNCLGTFTYTGSNDVTGSITSVVMEPVCGAVGNSVWTFSYRSFLFGPWEIFYFWTYTKQVPTVIPNARLKYYSIGTIIIFGRLSLKYYYMSFYDCDQRDTRIIST
jgi:hypothetical protein